MDKNAEYHDPDYPEVPVTIKEEPPSVSEEEKVEKMKEIIRREFLNEVDIRENEVMLIDQRLTTSRRLLHRLRYVLVNSYYKEQKLQLTNGQIQDDIAAQHEPWIRAGVTTLLRDSQRRLHPSVRKLLGKKTVDLSELLMSRGPRNKARKDYSAMLQKRNYTISADTTKTLRPDKKPEAHLMDPPEEPCTRRPKKMPRHLDPKVTNVVTLDEVTRNKKKYRYRIVIGNTSKYAPPASRADRSTHKWLLYIRGPPHAPDISPIVTAVTVQLHHSYAPHHTVHIDKPPFHISRRGWGEFPAKIELHFVLPERNRPATVEHNIKLDRNYTGMQMLGSETLVDVWLYSTQDMLQYEFKEDAPVDNVESTEVKTLESTQTDMSQDIETNTDSMENYNTQTDDWVEFFAKGPSQVDVDEMIIKPVKKETIMESEKDLDIMIESNVIKKSPSDNETLIDDENIKVEKCWDEYAPFDNSDIPNEILNQPSSLKKRIVKYIDPSTGKIYYLEMDRALDLTKVQEIVINNKSTKISPIRSNGLKSVRKKKGGMSLLKPEVKSMLRTETITTNKTSYSHIENDHCYLATPKRPEINYADVEIKKEKSLYGCLCSTIGRFNNVRAAVNFLVKRIPLISGDVRDSEFLRHFPFVVESDDRYWKLDFAKRRNIEWSRAKLINRMLSEHFAQNGPIWRTKQILLYSRLHGHYPVRHETFRMQTENDDWSSWNDLENSRKLESSIKEYYSAADINTLSMFNVKDSEANMSDVVELSDEEDVDIVSCHVRRHDVKKETGYESKDLVSLPVEGDEDRLRFLFIEKKCNDIGLELRNEDVGNGYSYSAVHAVLLSSMKSFAEELTRSALAAKLTQNTSKQSMPPVWTGSSSSRVMVNLEHVLGGVANNPRLQLLTRTALAASKKKTTAL